MPMMDFFSLFLFFVLFHMKQAVRVALYLTSRPVKYIDASADIFCNCGKGTGVCALSQLTIIP